MGFGQPKGSPQEMGSYYVFTGVQGTGPIDRLRQQALVQSAGSDGGAASKLLTLPYLPDFQSIGTAVAIISTNPKKAFPSANVDIVTPIQLVRELPRLNVHVLADLSCCTLIKRRASELSRINSVVNLLPTVQQIVRRFTTTVEQVVTNAANALI